jgi:cell division protease FtsH
MENRVIAILGGKAATELVYGAPDVGCNSDMHRAFDIVERFVDNYCRYGFDKFERNNSSNVLLAKKESFIHAELDRFYARAKELLSSNRHLLDSLTDALVSRKTLASGDIAKLCAKRERERVAQ